VHVTPVSGTKKYKARHARLRYRTEIEDFLTRKWNLELDYRLIKELWTFRENRIGTRQPS
jgi:uncharacterized protein